MDRQRRAQYLQALDITEWGLRKTIAPIETLDAQQDVKTDLTDLDDESVGIAAASANNSPALAREENIEQLVEQVPSEIEPVMSDIAATDEEPTALAQVTAFVVQGSGNAGADCIVLGSIAVDDDEQFAFNQDDNALLAKMLQAIQLSLADVFIIKPLSCLATTQRDPQDEELQQCREYILAHIEAIQPKAILVMDPLVAQVLLGEQKTIANLSGHVHDLPNSPTKLVVTFSPAHLLKKPTDKRKAWEDLKRLKQVLN